VQQTKLWYVRNPKDTPFYCSPVHMFFVEWALMLSTLLLRISYLSFPDFSVGLFLFALASISFVAGFWTLSLVYKAMRYNPWSSDPYSINIARLRRFHLASVIVVLSIMLMNVKLYGLPPIFGFAGVDTLTYQEYGSLRQPLFTLIMVLFVSAPLESSFWRRWALYLFSPACLLIYVSRGYLLIMFFQALAVFSLRTQLSKKKIYVIAGMTFAVALLASNAIGNGRSSIGVDALLGYLQIKPAYYDWPAAYLWLISYISSPISNMCWIVRVYQYQHPSWNFIYSALPGFWSSLSLEQVADLGSEKIIDGVHTYMAKYFLDFWYFGIVGINYVWGLISAFLNAGNRITRNFLASGVLLGCMAFMFFSDFLTILIIILELGLVIVLQRYITMPVADGYV
jgi:hypothetical protein